MCVCVYCSNLKIVLATCMTQERMTLLSPGVPPPTSQPVHSGPRRFMFPTRPVRGHSVESDGYSEVFDGEEAPSSLPSGLITLMNAPFTSTPADSMNNTSKEEVRLATILKSSFLEHKLIPVVRMYLCL